VPGSDVERQRHAAEQDEHEDDRDDERLARFRAKTTCHSSRSFATAVSVPDDTVMPSSGIVNAYGYLTVTVTRLPETIPLGSEKSIAPVCSSLLLSRFDAESSTACFASAKLPPLKRAMIARLAPARAASVSVT